MKLVILIGDSIRMAYQPVVTRELEGTAHVWGPEENCRHSACVREHLQPWALDREPDLVHLNAGLHDIARPRKADGEVGPPAIPTDGYAENLRTCLSTIQKAGIRPILALSTPVNDQRHARRGDGLPDRFEADVENYNAIARAIARELNVPINDLYRVVMDHDRDALLSEDGVHFTKEGNTLLGQAVAGMIRAALE